MLKKITCLLLLCSIFCSYAYASENVETAISANNVYTLSLQDAITLATAQNPQLNVFDIKLQSANVSLDAAKLNRFNSKHATISISSGMAVAYIKESYYIDLYESQIRLNKLEKEKVQNSIAYNVTQKYFNYKLTERLINTSKESYKIALENKNTTDEKLTLGMISQLEVNNAAVSVEQSKLALETNERNLAIAKEDLKIALQLDGENCDFILTDDIDFVDYESDVDTDIPPALESRYDTTALREAEALSKRYFDITAKYSSSNTAIYNTAHSDYIQSNYNMTNNTKQIALSIRNDYNSILSAKGNLSIAEQNLAVKKQDFEASKLKFQMGMITNMQLTAIMNDLSQYETTVENAKLAYKLAVIKYQYNITIGL